MKENLRIDDRVGLYIDGFVSLINKIDPNDNYGLKLNIHLIEISIKEYFNNSDFIKNKHSIEYTNASKRMAFTIYYVIKNKPIYIAKLSDEIPLKILLINEIYALLLGISHLKYKKYFKNKDIVNNFLYLIHNKCIDTEAFAIVIDIFSKALTQMQGEK